MDVVISGISGSGDDSIVETDELEYLYYFKFESLAKFQAFNNIRPSRPDDDSKIIFMDQIVTD